MVILTRIIKEPLDRRPRSTTAALMDSWDPKTWLTPARFVRLDLAVPIGGFCQIEGHVWAKQLRLPHQNGNAERVVSTTTGLFSAFSLIWVRTIVFVFRLTLHHQSGRGPGLLYMPLWCSYTRRQNLAQFFSSPNVSSESRGHMPGR